MKKKKLKVVYMRPREKPVAWVGMFMVLKGSPRRRLAHAYVDAWSSTRSAKWLEDNYGYGHANVLARPSSSDLLKALQLTNTRAVTEPAAVLLLLLIAPFLTSYLLRVLAWKVILGNQGVINSFLFWTGLRSPDHPISQLLYSRFAVMLVLGYVWLPFVALPIFVSLESIDRRLLEAASDLGASRLWAFFRVTLPLSLPGVVAAFLFVFIPTLGEFVTPSLVGGASGYMYGNQIVDLFGTGFPDWETGSVLSLFLLGVVAVLTVVFSRFLRSGQVAAN